MKRVRKIVLIFMSAIVILCSGCGENFSQGLDIAKDITDAAVKIELAPDGEDVSKCKANLESVTELLNERNALDLKSSLSPDIIYDGLDSNYNALKEDRYNAQLNGIVFDGIVNTLFDKELDINYHTISDISFELKDMVDWKVSVKSHATMTNNGQKKDVIITWHSVDNWAGTYWFVHSIKSDE